MSDRLSLHFTLAEMQASQFAVRHGLNNHAPPEARSNLERLCANVLEHLRSALLAKPIIVSSGYRSPELNRAIGGARKSSHMEGRAADIVVHGVEPREVADKLAASSAGFDKLIVEFDRWVHVQIRGGTKPARRLQLIAGRAASGAIIYSRREA